MTRLRSQITPLTPTSFDTFARCPAAYYCRELLGVPASDAAPSNDQGLLVHDMLWRVHATGSCHDDEHVREVLVGHGADSDAVRELVARHARRCPSAGAGRRRARARARAIPPAAGADVHGDGTDRRDLDPRRTARSRRDYKTGSLWHTRVCDVPAAKVQAFALAPAAQRRGLQLRLRYEYLQPEIDEDPEPWDLDDDDLAAVEEELRAAVARMWDLDDWVGVAEADVCGRCQYRSICRDSATPGEPTWPVLSTAEPTRAPAPTRCRTMGVACRRPPRSPSSPPRPSARCCSPRRSSDSGSRSSCSRSCSAS